MARIQFITSTCTNGCTIYSLQHVLKTTVGHFPQSELSIILVGGAIGGYSGSAMRCCGSLGCAIQVGLCPPPREIAVSYMAKQWASADQHPHRDAEAGFFAVVPLVAPWSAPFQRTRARDLAVDTLRSDSPEATVISPTLRSHSRSHCGGGVTLICPESSMYAPRGPWYTYAHFILHCMAHVCPSTRARVCLP